jgi:hypothetical protein
MSDGDDMIAFPVPILKNAKLKNFNFASNLTSVIKNFSEKEPEFIEPLASKPITNVNAKKRARSGDYENDTDDVLNSMHSSKKPNIPPLTENLNSQNKPLLKPNEKKPGPSKNLNTSPPTPPPTVSKKK